MFMNLVRPPPQLLPANLFIQGTVTLVARTIYAVRISFDNNFVALQHSQENHFS